MRRLGAELRHLWPIGQPAGPLRTLAMRSRDIWLPCCPAGGLTLRHSRAFENCPMLPALRGRVRAELPEYEQFGIHVMVSQNGSAS